VDRRIEATQEAAPPSWLVPLALSWLIVVATLLTYIPALSAGFVFDDETFVTDNPLIRANDGLYRLWFTTQPLDYFPLTSTLLWFEWRLWGMNPAGYHVVNVFLHAISAVLIWRVLRRLGIPWAWPAALVFAVHPVNVESVAWITECKNVLPMLFYALTLLLYLRYLQEGGKRWYLLSVGSFLLALLAKTSVVMLPVVLLMCAAWLRRRISWQDLRDSLPFFALSGALALVTVWFQYHRAIGMTVVRDDGPLSRLVCAGWAVWFYLYKAILPYGLSIVYPRWSVNLSNPLSYIPVLLLAACFAVLWRYRGGWARGPLFALGYYVVMLLPVLGFFNISFMYYSLVADHWQYFSLPAVIALGVGLCGYASGHGSGRLRPLGLVAATAVVGVLCTLTWHQAGIYKDNGTLWRDTLVKNPDCFLAHGNLAVIFQRKGDNRAAKAHYAEALRIKPDFTDAHFDLGTILITEGRSDEAIAHFREALRAKPDSARTHNNLAAALLEQGKPQEAIVHLQKAIEINPNSPQRLRNLAWLLATHSDAGVRDGRRAVRMAERACELTNYEQPELLSTLAAACAEAGRFDEAREWARKAIELAARSGQRALADRVRTHLRFYESSRAFHETP
jgi:Flp pilus assembly protein TadD